MSEWRNVCAVTYRALNVPIVTSTVDRRVKEIGERLQKELTKEEDSPESQLTEDAKKNSETGEPPPPLVDPDKCEPKEIEIDE